MNNGSVSVISDFLTTKKGKNRNKNLPQTRFIIVSIRSTTQNRRLLEEMERVDPIGFHVYIMKNNM